MGMISQEKVFRVFRFLTVGGTVTLLDFSLTWLLHLFLPALVAVSIAYVTAITCHFLLNKFWVFRCQRSDHGKQLLQYGVNVFCAWLVMINIVRFCLATFTTNILVAKAVAVPPVTVFGFLYLQLVVFRHRPPSSRVRGSAFGVRRSSPRDRRRAMECHK